MRFSGAVSFLQICGMGIYVHVPFCRSKCHYCGFYSVASFRYREEWVNAVCREARLRKDYAGTEAAASLYFGGGTPSVLSFEEIKTVKDCLAEVFRLLPGAENTIEVNPDDVDSGKAGGWRALGFNRASVGIQSFSTAVLKGIGRKHSPETAVKAVEILYRSGFRNISADLMIGLPGQRLEDVLEDVRMVSALPLTHISVYMLGLDKGSIFYKKYGKGMLELPEEETVAEEYTGICDNLEALGFEHYEISNFAKPDMYSRHNTAYWEGRNYVGLGPGAHSYDGNSRQWNTADIRKYTEGVEKGYGFYEKEILGPENRFNEYVMTRLRQAKGMAAAEAELLFPDAFAGLKRRVDAYVRSGHMKADKGRMTMTRKGWLISDDIFVSLFI